MDDTIVEQDIGAHDLSCRAVTALNENSGRVPSKVELLSRSADSSSIVADLRGVNGRAIDDLQWKEVRILIDKQHR